jgi:prepilin-type N-terminal cleavage/methylation domain-containing protein/prepilin-type processing-associated H-X9-DG protein
MGTPASTIVGRISIESRVRRAVTLIELLVVIFIIGILAGLLLPSLSHARLHARQVHCLTQMRSLGVATGMYVDENHDQFPLVADTQQVGGWTRSLAPYLDQQTEIYRCPGDKSEDWYRDFDPPAQKLINDRMTSYGINIYLSPAQLPPAGALDQRPKYGFVSRRMIPYPADTVQYGEVADTEAEKAAPDHLHADAWSPSPLTGLPLMKFTDEIAINRHSGPCENYTYADGHAEGLKFRETFEWNEETGELRKDRWNPLARRTGSQVNSSGNP